MMNFDAMSLYTSAMLDEKSVHPKIESGFVFKPHMKNVYVEALQNQFSNKDGIESAVLKIYITISLNLNFNISVKKKKYKKLEADRMRNGYVIQYLNCVDIQDMVKTRSKLIKNYQGVIYRENFKVSPFRKVIEKIFVLRQRYKVESNDLKQKLVILIMNSLYGVQIRKDINESYKCKTQHWMETKNVDNVLDYWRLPNGNLIVK